jgi:hypothetical protein
MSRASRHFSRCRTAFGILHRARRRRTSAAASGSVIVVSSQEGGRNSRQLIAAEAQSVTACTLTPIWQFPTFPNVPEYMRATPGESRPSLGKPLSSTT